MTNLLKELDFVLGQIEIARAVAPELDIIKEYILEVTNALRSEAAMSCANCALADICLMRREIGRLIYDLDTKVPPGRWDRKVVSARFYCEMAARCSYYQEAG